jgi:DNA-binding NarL/FixJ family response regulator
MNSYKILIVDDSALVVDRLFENLHEMKCVDKLFSAHSYLEAINQIKQQLPHFVLLDIQLPGKNGIELLSFIKQNYPNIVTIMLTNMVSDYYKDLCNNIGADYFIDKSSEFEKIPGIIETYFQEVKISLKEKPPGKFTQGCKQCMFKGSIFYEKINV